jgi:hypothetical protein
MISERVTLPSGPEVTLTMPDLFSILATVGTVPSQQILDVINLLTEDRVYRPTSAKLTPDQSQLTKQIRFLKGVYAITLLCITDPVGLTASDLTYADVEAVYYGFFRGHVRPSFAGNDPGPAVDLDGDTGVGVAG